MDFSQKKLSESEWNNIEISVNDTEKQVLQLIIDGFHDPKTVWNPNRSFIGVTKLSQSPEIEYYIYTEYFKAMIDDMDSAIASQIKFANGIKKKKLSKSDIIRFSTINVATIKKSAFEYTLLDLAEKCLSRRGCPKSYYTLTHIIRGTEYTVSGLNQYVLQYIGAVIDACVSQYSVDTIFNDAYNIIEKNALLLQNQNVGLYSHQARLFEELRRNADKSMLILYTSPTGCGKTLSVVGICEKFRVIFMCASRHICLELAKSAISMGRKIAIAFGCETADDIRLHYSSAKVFTINKRSGGIKKVDNSHGENVELMICDIKSYTVAMEYMLLFNDSAKIVTYWDEPTISMDYDEHPLHDLISKNWRENVIPKMILSCATLPPRHEIEPTIEDFSIRFGGEVRTISSFDFKKNIPVLNSDGVGILPHTLFGNDNRRLIECAEFCVENATLLRYMDLRGIVEFVRSLQTCGAVELWSVAKGPSVLNLTMMSIKMYYLDCLKRVEEAVQTEHTPFWEGGITGSLYLSTKDAFTLTDGPSLYLTENVERIGQFLVQQAKIPEFIIQNLQKAIEKNNAIEQQIAELKKKIEDNDTVKNEDSNKKEEEENSKINNTNRTAIEYLNSQFIVCELPRKYIPNTVEHQSVWASSIHQNAFVSTIPVEYIKRVMELGETVSDDIKLLFLMGIGILSATLPTKYLEVIKELSYMQSLYIIVASSDYIYGTNYQFCHGFIGKDLQKMTQQKIIQSIGRVGRRNIQQTYTVRFRENSMIERLFSPLKDELNCEAVVMNRLFCSD